MSPNNNLKNRFTFAENFLIEKILELTNSKTYDTYRAKLRTPYSLMKELYEVIDNFKNNKIKSYETVSAVVDELESLIKDESVIIFNSISKKYFLKLLKCATKDNIFDGKLLHSIKTLLNDNINYSENLFNTLINEVKVCNNKELNLPIDINYLDSLINFYVTNILNKNVSKDYINKDLYVFVYIKKKPFVSIQNLIKQYSQIEDKAFIVVFKYNSNKELSELLPQNFFQTPSCLDTLFETEKINKFLNSKSNNYPINLFTEVKAKDYYSAVNKAFEEISKILDGLYFGFLDIEINLFERVLSIDINDAVWAKECPLFFYTTGNIKSGDEHYKEIIKNVESILISDFIESTTKEKIISSIRHLSQGNKSQNIENKFLNYWIGFEYLFSKYEDSPSTFKRIKEFFPSIHCINYPEILYKEQTRKIENITLVKNESNSTDYLAKREEDNVLNFEDNNYPLLNYRSSWLNCNLFDKNSFKKIILLHKRNLEQHIVRIYRFRNAIVHEASVNAEIETLASNLRYYLTFIIEEIILYFSNKNDFYVNNLKHNMEQFFINKLTIYEDMLETNFDTEKDFETKLNNWCK